MRPRQTMLLTQCPACQTAFRLTLDDLAIAAGQVQCGHCQHIFNAIEHGAEESGLSGEDSLPGSPLAEGGVDDGLEVDFIDENVLDEGYLDGDVLAEDSLHEAALDDEDALEEDEVIAAVENEFSALTGQTNPVGETASIDSAEPALIKDAAVDLKLKRPRGFAVDRTLFLSGLLILLFLVQAMMIFSENLLANRHTRSWLEAGCDLFNCEIPTFIDIDSLAIKESEITPLDSMGQRLITAHLYNSADLAQPLPDLLLELTDGSGVTVARRIFNSDEYLTEASSAGFVGAGASLPLSLQMVLTQSSFSVMGYRLQLMPSR